MVKIKVKSKKLKVNYLHKKFRLVFSYLFFYHLFQDCQAFFNVFGRDIIKSLVIG